ncbi:hypothetical protein GQ55_8G221400 [Panicum hallii var. hallii]|uniref:Uncharacterized protein n=1 Tax=Panicum hallii var. hallii TaxID=1504633 RepID=A0A2T7CQ15_9POAL|nr:hypothetical protein GQ55_8G221400 [Panicum hallii var. hallii]
MVVETEERRSFDQLQQPMLYRRESLVTCNVLVSSINSRLKHVGCYTQGELMRAYICWEFKRATDALIH